MSSVKPIPKGYHSITPYLIVKGAAQALAFYREAFGAEEVFRMAAPDGSIAHAEIRIGDSHVMLADENPAWGAFAPDPADGKSPMSLMFYCEDVDAMAARAVAAGATEIRPVQDQFYGDRSGTFRDPFGHMWTIGTHVEDVPPDELQRRFEAMASQ